MKLPLPLPWFLADVAVRTLIMLVVLIVGIRLFGKRQMGELNMFDVVAILLVGNAIQNAITGGKGILSVGLVSAGVMLALDRLLGILFVKKPEVEKVLAGSSTVILEDGQIDQSTMEREGVDKEEIFAAMRDVGLMDLSQVGLAILEPDGTISVIPKENK